jgi:Domain of unknown function (DUF4397)
MNMNKLNIYLLLGASLSSLVACGGNDAEDRLNIADPVVRFVHASPVAPNLTLFRNDVARVDVTNVAYQSASNYIFTDSDAALWQAKTSQGNVLYGALPIDVKRGNRYTIVAFPSTTTDSTLYEIRDPYNKSITSDRAKLRIVNGSFNANNIDLYLNPIGTDITAAAVVPAIANTAYKTAGPASGNDSLDIDGGNYQISITTAGSKRVLFKGIISIEKNKDLLLLTLPDSILPNAIKTLVKVDGDAVTKELPAN